MEITLKNIWDKILVILVSTQTPLIKITKKNKRNGIINTNKRTDKSINNQLILFLLVLVNKYSYYKGC